MAYTPPQLEFYQDYQPAPATTTNPQRALIVGPLAEVVRYSVASEREAGALGDYDPGSGSVFTWPNQPSGSKVDLDYTRLWAKEVSLLYTDDSSGALVTPGGDPQDLPPNYLELDSASLGFKTNTHNGTIYGRHSAIGQDVRIGDIVRLTYSGEDPVEARVSGITGRKVPGATGVVTAGGGNAQDQVQAGTANQTLGTPVNKVEIDSVGAGYDGLSSGYLSETYTIRVVTGGIPASAVLSVTSASGTDNQASVTPAAFASPTAIGTRGLEVTFINTGSATSDPGVPDDEFYAGQEWVVEVDQLFAEVSLTAGGSNSSPLSTSYVVTVVRGGDTSSGTASEQPQVLVTTIHGVDSSGPTNLTSTTFNIGSTGVTGTFSSSLLAKGDVFNIPVAAESIPVLNILQLDRVIALAHVGTAANSVQILQPKRDVEIPAINPVSGLLNWTRSASGIEVEPGLTLAGDSAQLPVESASLYSEHRMWISSEPGTVSVAVGSTFGSTMPGPIHPDNPLKYAVSKAAANAGGDVWYSVVSDPDDVQSWTDAATRISERTGFYGIVPLSQDPVIFEAFMAAVETMAGPLSSKYHVLWYSPKVDRVAAVSDRSTSVNGTDLLIRRGSTLPSGEVVFLVQGDNSDFEVDGVRPGDVLRYLFVADALGHETWKEATIKTVLGKDGLILEDPGIPVTDIPANTDVRVEVWRNRTPEDMKNAYVQALSISSSFRARLVVPGSVGSAGLTVPGYHLCAAFAGFRSRAYPHQPLTNQGITGFDSVPGTRMLSTLQLNEIAEAGGFIVHQTQSGSIVCRHALTAYGPDDDLLSEDSVISNVDNFCQAIKSGVQDLVGIGNITGDLLRTIRLRVIGILTPYQEAVNPILGPQIVNVLEIQVAQSQADVKRVIIRVPVEIPVPSNTIETHVEISVSV